MAERKKHKHHIGRMKTFSAVEKIARIRWPLRISLRYKLAVPVFLLVFAGFSLVMYSTFTTVREMMTGYKESRLSTIAEVFAEALRIPMSEGDRKTLQAYVDLVAEQSDVEEVVVENVEGQCVGDSRRGPHPAPRLFEKQDFSGVRMIDPDRYATVAPIIAGDQILGRLIIVFTRVEIEKDLRKVFGERFLLASIFALLTTFIVLMITWLGLRPLFTLQRTARLILSGDLGARARIRSRDEIQEVGDAFNRVVTRLVQSFEHLRMRTHALEESEEKYRSIVNDVSDIIFSISPEGELTLLNRGFSGYTREEILAEGLPAFFKMHVPEDEQKIQDALELVVNTQQPILHMNTRHVHRAHQTDIYYQTNLTPVVDCEGNLRMIQGVMRDVTEIRQVEMMKETLIRDVAHELKTPTAKFIMTMQWFEREMEKSPDRERFLPMIKMLAMNADRLMRTISSIMDLSRIESGVVDVRKQAVNINDTLEMVVNDLRPLAAESHLEIHARLASEPLILMGDSDMIYRVYSNLVSNAIKFTPDGGSITVVSRSRENDLCVEVRDTGIGIEPEGLEKIFDAFYQRTPSSVGIGVGLTIAKKIVLMHEGQIWVESEGSGKGTTVKTVFPLLYNPV